jgi:hypothetical protein
VLVSKITGKSTPVLYVDWLTLLWAGLFDSGNASGTLIPLVPVKQRAAWPFFYVCRGLCLLFMLLYMVLDTLVCFS